MKEIKLVKDNITHRFVIEKRKSILKDDNIIFNIIKEYFQKSSSSEFSKECNSNSIVFIDNNKIELKNYSLFDISFSYYDLISEYKLAQKSLFYLSLESILNNFKYVDHLNTINILLDDLSTTIEEVYKSNNIDVLINNFDINFKNIIKLIDISLIKDDFETNQFDYSITELNNIKLSLIKMIVKNNYQHNYFILNEDISINTDCLLEFNNVHILTTERTNENNVYDCCNKIDFENEDELYNKYINSTTNLDYERFVIELLERLKD